MALRDLIYRCVVCGQVEPAGQGDTVVCGDCGARVSRGADGLLTVTAPGRTLRRISVPDAVDLVTGLGGPETDPPGAPVSMAATLGYLDRFTATRRAGELTGWVEHTRRADEGTLTFERSSLVFEGRHAQKRWAYRDIQAVQIASKALQVQVRKERFHIDLRISNSSTARAHDLLVGRISSQSSRDPILEFQPIIVSKTQSLELQGRRLPKRRVRTIQPAATGLPFYAIARAILRSLLPLKAPMSAHGLGNIPKDGPFILVANHQSLLDPIAVQVACPRVVRSLTKSTQFRKKPMNWLLQQLGAIPVRRFRTDPQAVRMVLRHLSAGAVVGIYPEGERSWDGRLQPFRRGTLRLLLAAGVPVVPAAVRGTFNVWPRWSKRLLRSPIEVRFGRPIVFAPAPDRPTREARIPEAERALRRAFRELGVEVRPD
jgi:1-acyl-sn-glycerol-3-phosphate acyltransferase